MYLYDTRNGKDELRRFPINGWFFPCINCRSIIGTKKDIIFKKYLFFKPKYIEIPCCKRCNIDENLVLDKTKIQKIN